LSPGFWRRREREGGQAGGFAGGDAQQPQPGLGELIDGDLVDASGAPLGARHLPRLDVAQRARRQAAGDVQDVQAGTGEEPGRLPWAGEFILGARISTVTGQRLLMACCRTACCRAGGDSQPSWDQVIFPAAEVRTYHG